MQKSVIIWQTFFINFIKIAKDLDILLKKYYNIEYLCGILYCKNPKVVSVITQCYPMCKLEDCDIYIEDKYQKAQVDDIKEETLSQTTN